MIISDNIMEMTTSSTDRKRLLIVDDTPDNIRLLSLMLSEEGYKVRKALNGKMALNSCSADPPDLVILDIKMPDMDGYTVCQKLKSNSLTREIPVIFISALDDALDKVRAFQVGGVDYISKPFQCEEVLARVKSQLTIRDLTSKLEQKVEARTAALVSALESLQNTHLQLIQSEKMATLGQLVAGIAHEINNPLGFITSNIEFARTEVKQLSEHLALYQQKFPEPGEEIVNHRNAIDLDYVLEDLPTVIESMNLGSERIYGLSVALRKFSRKNNEQPVEIDLYDGLDSTLLILKHRLKANKARPPIKLVQDYVDLPKVSCYPEQLNQVFMNLLANSVDALDERAEGEMEKDVPLRTGYEIKISTHFDSGESTIQIRISDNALGIPESVKPHIFDYQFTTKPPGKGTGLGLAISSQIVQEHGGTLECDSVPQQGTTFTISLPIHRDNSDSSE